jgi:hypothetical protein
MFPPESGFLCAMTFTKNGDRLSVRYAVTL